MFPRMIVPVLACLVVLPPAASAQSTAQDATTQDEDTQEAQQKIRDQLTAEGFKDVKVVASSFIASGKDRNGKPVVMLIGPNSMTMMTPAAPGDPSPQSNTNGLIHE